jgi:transmembrane sensor
LHHGAVTLTSVVHIDPEVAEEAAQWLLRVQDGDLGDFERREFDAWRARSPMHASAWQRAEQLLYIRNDAPDGLGRDALERLRKLSRRRALRSLAVLLVAAPLGWRVAQQAPLWTADVRTAKGERRSISLPDGAHLVLNSNSAVDIGFNANERRLHLHAGEILITTQPDVVSPPRALRVETNQGWVRALGTRFTVRQLETRTHVAIFEHAVEITTRNGGAQVLCAGEQASFSNDTIDAPTTVSPLAVAWENGLFVANRIKLSEFVVELARHRDGYLRCHTAVADMLVSGTFPIGNDDRALALLAKTLPLSIARTNRFWVVIEPK